MCLFPAKNKVSNKAFLKGLEEFECGHCPECLAKKSRLWALRTSMEARVNFGFMCTLTYDSYKVVNGIETSVENPTDPNIALSKEDCQKFIKRLRERFKDCKVKYILTAERGKRTDRAHYHALIFGIKLPDLIPYKLSKRGNQIYKSKILSDIWNKGICTVDSINLNAKTARYCTKYCAKDSGAEDTFMLFSRGIGDSELLRLFNGKSYWVDGREYPIPKLIWQKVIEKRYNIQGFSKYKGLVHLEESEKQVYNVLKRFDNNCVKVENLDFKIFKYWNYAHANEKKALKARRTYTRFKYMQLYSKHLEMYNRLKDLQKELIESEKKIEKRVVIITQKLENSPVGYQRSKEKREIFEHFRDNDIQYKRYLDYWKRKGDVFNISRPSIEQRILSLPNNKYRSYKNQAIKARGLWSIRADFVPPRTNSQAFLKFKDKKKMLEKSFAPLSRHYWANDRITGTLREKCSYFRRLAFRVLWSRNAEDMEMFEVIDIFQKKYKKPM